jgi:hypothetical protein
MRFFDYAYYCIYRYVLKTPDKAAAGAWPGAFLGVTLLLHAAFAYELFALIVSGALWPIPNKLTCLAAMLLLVGLFYWYYDWRDNGVRVIRSFEKRGNPAKYARIGAVIWYEGLLFPFIVIGVLILSQKLTGWPPHP